MPKIKKPRSGSLAYYPRKRARRIYPRIKTYPVTEKSKPMAFAGYKAGMLTAIIVDNKKGSATFGQNISVPITVLDSPPLKVVGVRAYKQTTNGLVVLTEAWDKKLPKYIDRKIKLGKPKIGLEEIEKNLAFIVTIRLIVATQPKLSGVGKKKPEIFEIGVGGKDVKEQFEYAKSVLGKELKAADVFQEGEIVDVIAVTKGKGYAGPVKRFGVKIQTRHAKGKRRHVGAVGSQTPTRIIWTIPMAGQMGFQTRTEINKRILKIEDGKKKHIG